MRETKARVRRSGKKRVHFAWIVLIGVCIFVGLSRSGINSAGGLFMAPVMAEIGCGAGEFMLYFSIESVITFLFLPVAGKLMAKYDIRFLLVAGLIFLAGAFALFGSMRSIWGWYLLSVPMAIGSVFTTQIAGPVLIGNWFKKHNGLAIGIMMASAGLCGVILQPMAGSLITNQGWRSAYVILGVIVMAIGIPAVLLTVRAEPRQMGLRPLGDGEPDAAAGESAVTHGVPAKAARKTAAFWALILFMFLITAVASFSQHMPKYAEQLGFDTAFAGGAMGFFMLGLTAGALVFGLLSDKLGAEITAVFALICGIAGILMAIFLGGQPLFFYLSVALLGFTSAGSGTLGPLLTAAVFGRKEYGEIYSTVAMGMALAGIVAMPGYGFLFDAVGSYVPALWMICIMLAACVVCVAVAFAGKKNMMRNGAWQ